MTQIIVTLEENSPVSSIENAISLIRGVQSVFVKKNTNKTVVSDEDLNRLPYKIRRLIGVGSNISAEDIASDDRLAYILSK